MMQLDELEALQRGALAELEIIQDADTLHNWEIKYLGKKGLVIEAVRGVIQLPKEQRAEFGKRANQIKEALTIAHDERDKTIQAHALALDLETGEVDITLPGRTRPSGGLHPSTQTLREFYDIWADMGFQVYRS